MALTPEEQAELESLKASTPVSTTKSSKLSPEEEAEMHALSQEKSSLPEMYENFLGNDQDKMDALRGVASGATLGGQNILGGAVQSGADLVQSGLHKLLPHTVSESPTQVAARLKSQGVKGDIGPASSSDMYYQGKHETSTDFDQANERSPYLYGAGQLAGGSIIPAGSIGKVAKGATALQKIGAGAKVGAAIGAGAGFLGGKSDLGGQNANPLGALKETAEGTATGAALGTAGALATEGIEKAAPAFKRFASNRAAAAVNIPSNKNIVKDAAGKEIRNVGQTLLDQDALPAFKNTEDTIENINQKLAENESQLQSKLEEAQAKTKARQVPENEKYKQQLDEYNQLYAARKMKPSVIEAPVSGDVIPDEAIPEIKSNLKMQANASEQEEALNTPPMDTGESGLSPEEIEQIQSQQGTKPVNHGETQDFTSEGEAAPYAELNKPTEGFEPDNTPELSAKPEQLPPELPMGQLPLPESLLNANQLEDEVYKIVKTSTKDLAGGASDQKLKRQIIKEFVKKDPETGMSIIDQLKRDANDPVALNQLKRRIGNTAKKSKAAFADSNAPIMTQTHEAVYDLVKNQIEHLADATGGELGQSIKNLNRTSSELIQAKDSINPNQSQIRLPDIYPRTANLANLGSKVITGKPITAIGNIAAAKTANAIGNFSQSGSMNLLSAVTPSRIGQKVQSNIYNESKAQYSQYAEKLSANPNTAHIAKLLQDGIDTNDSIKQNQALFLIKQTPAAKKAIEDNSQ